MERRITATAARVRFGEVMRRVAKEGERIIVERAGQPQVVILSVADYEWLKAAQRPESWRAALERAIQAGVRIRVRREGKPLTPADEIIRQVREERDAPIAGLR